MTCAKSSTWQVLVSLKAKFLTLQNFLSSLLKIACSLQRFCGCTCWQRFTFPFYVAQVEVATGETSVSQVRTVEVTIGLTV